MAEWTPEATEYLDGYLKQVCALARGAGEDGDDIASGLREHIIEKTERGAGPLVTLEVLRRALAEVGAPEAIVDGGAAWRTSSVTPGEDVAAERRASPLAQGTERPAQDRSGRFLRWSIGCALLLAAGMVTLSVLSMVAAMVLPAMARGREAARRAECQNHLKQIGLAIARFEDEHPNDAPRKMTDLYPRYIGEIEVFACPSSSNSIREPSELDEWSAYEFIASSSGDDQPVVREKDAFHVPMGRNVLYKDGRVEFVRDREHEEWGPVEDSAAAPRARSQADKRTQDAVRAVQEIARAERVFIEKGGFDQDNDGAPDYGDLDDLDAETGEVSTFGRHDVEGFVFHVELTPSSQPSGPSFVCRAIPVDDSVSEDMIAIGPDGVLRFMTKDEMKREQAAQRLN